MGLYIQDWITLFLGLLVEAFPFVVIGVLVSIAVEMFVKEEKILKIIPNNTFVSHICFALIGFFLPVCECGNVPVVRKFIQKGFKVSHSITFLLAAPIVNPITFYATYEAFSFDPTVAWLRIFLGAFIAVAIGMIFSREKNDQVLLSKDFVKYCENHYHTEGSKLSRASEIFIEEFITVWKMLIIGAAIAATTQLLIPREIITSIGTNPILSVLAMIILALIVSICANVDAFFALAYSSTFTIGSLLSFMLFGPMIDIKILSMLKDVFTVRTLVIIFSLVFLFSFLFGLMINYYY